MRLLPRGLASGRRPSCLLLVLLVLLVAARVSEAAGGATKAADAQTAADPAATQAPETSTTPPETSSTTTDSTTTTDSSTSTSETSTTTSTTESTTTSSTMDPTTTTSTTTSSTSSTDSTTTTSSTTTSSTSSTSSGAASSGGYPIVTVPPTAGAPYMQTTNTPEGTVFIAVGAALGLIGLALLAWRAMVAWSVNRSVRRAAMMQSENKRLLRTNKKRSTMYSAAPTASMSLDRLGAGAKRSSKARVPSTHSGLFFSPTAGGGVGVGSHTSLNAGASSAGNRASNYLPAGYYAAAGSSTPATTRGGGPDLHAGLSSPGYPPNISPTLPPTSTFHDPPHNQRQSYAGASTSSLNLNQVPQGRAPSAYLEDLFESHVPPHHPDSGRR
ncbi:hypothetical protein N7474_003102 [Penicillium riverlandense]|uniref:uncharacterized protein n=1 Tax=Penicillium riverlandense TaxID=1903569 RepID=UPI0025470EB4|nr:uncharacterized protein N7474_003102 [Penicillium riverlandense]KAJ5825964.1 hypothetical protein N7474_003102 [Penicillium riverlandense]